MARGDLFIMKVSEALASTHEITMVCGYCGRHQPFPLDNLRQRSSIDEELNDAAVVLSCCYCHQQGVLRLFAHSVRLDRQSSDYQIGYREGLQFALQLVRKISDGSATSKAARELSLTISETLEAFITDEPH